MSASRTLAMRSAARAQLRAVPRTRIPGARFNSTQPINNSASQSHLVSGLAGGGVVLLGGYLWYHFSGLKTAVNTSQRISSTITSAKNQAIQSLPEPNQAIQYLRSVAKSYAVFIPGAAASIDSTFDAIEELHDSHRDEVDEIISGAYTDIKKIVNQRKSMDLDSAFAIVGVLQQRLGEFATFAGNLSSDVMTPILDKNPKLRDALGGSWDELKSLANRHGPEVKKLYDDTANKITNTVKSQGVTASSLASIVQIVREKADEARKLAERGAKDAWERARKQAGPALDKMPDVKKVLDENASTLMSVGGGGLAAIGGSNAKEIWDRIRQVADAKGGVDQKKVDELRQFIQDKVQKATKGGSGVVDKFTEGGFENIVKMIPGGQKALESTPNLQELFKVAQSKSGDAQKLTQETYEEILKVLKNKAEKAKKLGESAANEAKESKS
ncbi:hypothetical protein FRC12_003224 [Ceratobasidium sp. 428]|nr:hypothetical protein FRC09_009329 [Ceratobasidium sp. 395]KAG8772155.1 hypothetical protein FRC12_003224 [Ceratobasidium sp. 428]